MNYFAPLCKLTIARDVRCVIGKHQFVSLGVILYVISSIHEPKVRATWGINLCPEKGKFKIQVRIKPYIFPRFS